jgi:hypothetical protein
LASVSKGLKLDLSILILFPRLQEMAMNKPVISSVDLAHLGGGVLGYVRKIEPAAAAKLVGNSLQVPPNAELFCLYNAAGAPISISVNYQAAIGSALEHELIAASVH